MRTTTTVFCKGMLLLTALCTTSFAFSQSFHINTHCVDALPNGNFHFSIGGEAVFNDSMVVTVAIISNDSLQTVIFSGTKDFANAANTTLNNFTIDAVSHTFNVSLTDLPGTQYFVFIRSSIAGEMKEEVLVPAFITI